MNGRFRMKKASGRIDKEGKDNGVGDWISVASPDDLFKHGVNDFDFGKLNYCIIHCCLMTKTIAMRSDCEVLFFVL